MSLKRKKKEEVIISVKMNFTAFIFVAVMILSVTACVISAAEAQSGQTPVTQPVTAGIPQLTISQTSLIEEPEVGEEAVITVTLLNAGDGIAKNVQITERIPSSVSISYVDGADKAGNLVTWTGDLNPRESHSIQHTFTILAIKDRFFTARVTFEDAAGSKRETSTEIYIMTERPPATPPPTPTPTPPGFEIVFAIVGLLAVAYLLRRGR